MSLYRMPTIKPEWHQADPFSAISSAFMTEPDPNEVTAACVRILIHTVNSSLFSDTNPDSITWIGPPPETIAVQTPPPTADRPRSLGSLLP